jgi:hypothetical protein
LFIDDPITAALGDIVGLRATFQCSQLTLPPSLLSGRLREKTNSEIDEPAMTSATTLKAIRQVHHFVGLFFAPTILFFAITGGLQMFGLHETSRGSSYVPPALLVHLSQLHKKGTLYVPPKRAPQPAAGRPDGAKPDAPKPPQPPAPQPPNPLPMKIFFAATALALVTSTCTGIVMGWKYARRKSTVLLILVAGIALPLILLLV